MSNYNPPANQYHDKHQIPLILGLAAIALGQALQVGNGFLTRKAIYWLTASILCLGYTLFFNKESSQGFIKKISFPILMLGLFWQIYQLATTQPGIYLLPSSVSTLWMFRCGVIIAGGLAFISLAPKNWISALWQNISVCLTLLTFFLLGIWVIKNSPAPFIDVYDIHQASADALLHGQNPYTTLIPNIYGHDEFFGEGLIKGDFLNFSNPYPPLTIYVSTVGYLIGGDVRYSHLLAIVLSGAFIAFLHAGREAKIAAFIFLFTPRVFFVLELSWTEPILVLFLSAVIFCAIHYPRWLPVTLGLFFASKQYLVPFIPLTLLFIPLKPPFHKWIKTYGQMIAVMIAVTAPLAFWDLQVFIWNVITSYLHYSFRFDSLSYLAFYVRIFNQFNPQSIQYTIPGFIALVISFFMVWHSAPRNLSGFVLSIAFCIVIFFAFSTHAFCNYYFLVIGAICCTFASFTMPEQEKVLYE